MDALAVISVCYHEDINLDIVEKHFQSFNGAKRRFTETFVGNNIIIDDYVHHPNEIKSTINAIKQKYPDKLVVSIFQPHTFTRTEEFADDIAKELSKTDFAYIMDIHPAREKQEDYPNITSIEANDDFTSFTVTTKSTELDFAESFSVLAFYIYGGMYNQFNGTPVDNVHVDFVNADSGEIISSADSKDLAEEAEAE